MGKVKYYIVITMLLSVSLLGCSPRRQMSEVGYESFVKTQFQMIMAASSAMTNAVDKSLKTGEFWIVQKYADKMLRVIDSVIADFKTINPPEKYKAEHEYLITMADSLKDFAKVIRKYGTTGDKQYIKESDDILYSVASKMVKSKLIDKLFLESEDE